MILIAVLALLIRTWTGQDYKKKILNDSSITSATVTKIEYAWKSGYVTHYHFTVNNLEYLSQTNHANMGSSINSFINKKFPVIYSKADPNYNMVLIRPDDFRDFGLPFPDSLYWVLKYFK